MSLKDLLEQGENQAIEFKAEEVRAESLAKEIVAFSNAGGGVVLIGVADDGQVSGLSRDKDFVDWVANISRNNIVPPVICAVSLESYQGKQVGIVDVPKGLDKPYQTLNNQYLIRVGATNRVASIQELMRLFQQSGVFHYDATLVERTKLSDFNFNSLDKYFLPYQRTFSEEENKENLLSNMDVMQDGKATVAGLLIFGINPQRYLPNACISYAHYQGNQVSDELIDKQVIDGALPEQIDKTLTVIKHNIKQPSRISGAKTTALGAVYPDKVLRELIVNAVTHRNYSISGSRVRILQFDDRIEFISPGRLPNTVTVEKLKYGVSYATNTIILKFLENMRYVDKLGRGLPMVCQEVEKLNRRVEFEEIGEEFKVVLFF